MLDGIGTTLLIMVFVFIFAGALAYEGCNPRLLRLMPRRSAWIGGFFRGTGIATPSDNNLLLYALIFFIIGVPVGLPVSLETFAVACSRLTTNA